jgi:lambda family phage tail tape measure protein
MDDLDTAYAGGRISDYAALLNEESALEMQNLAGRQDAMDAYYDLWKETHRSSMSYMAEASREFNSGMSNVFEDIFDGTEKAGSLFKKFGDVVINTIAKIQAQKLAASLTASIFGSLLGGSSGFTYQKTGVPLAGGYGGTLHLADGGHVRGPGTGTSDSILSWLSNKEFVMSAEATEAIGVGNLNYMNQNGELPGFAAGGLVTGPSLSSMGSNYTGGALPSGKAAAPNVQIIIENKSGQQLSASKNVSMSEDLSTMIINMVVDGVSRNQDGSRDNLAAALGV